MGVEPRRQQHRRRVLDAGCGGDTLYESFDDAEIVGIDLDPEALQRNPRIDEAIVGDLMTYPFEPNSFDAIVCQDVLEHLPNPIGAIERFATLVKPGGTIELRFPNLISAKGLITKFTPHRFHLWFYRRILGSQDAGRPGYGPYRTYLRLALRPSSLRRRGARLGLATESVEFADGGFRAQRPFLNAVLRLLQRNTDCLIVFRKI